MTVFCVYHRVDLDGQCSAAIVRRKHPSTVMAPYQYGDELDLAQFRDHDVIMCDVSLQPFERMRELARMCRLTWIDHHATQLDEHQKEPADLYDGALSRDEKVGCELTWGWAFPYHPMPRAVYLLGRYDVWDLEADADVLTFQYGMRAYDTKPEWATWERFFDGYGNGAWCRQVVKEGQTILRYTKQQNKKACESAFDAEIDGLRCICLNMPRTGSHVFDSIWAPGKYDAMCSFYNHGNQNWSISLYTDKDDIDVGAVAKSHGGGGHKGAAGWQADVLPPQLLPMDTWEVTQKRVVEEAERHGIKWQL